MLLALSTGDPIWDVLTAILASVIGAGGAAKIVAKFRGLLREIGRAMEVSARIDALEQKFAKYEQEDAIQKLIYFGFLEAGEEACIIANEQGKTVLISPALAKLMGVSNEEATNGAWKDVLHPEDKSKVLIAWDGFVQGALQWLTLSFRFLTPSGRIVPVVMKAVRKKIVQGGVMRIVGLVWRQDSAPPKVPDTATS